MDSPLLEGLNPQQVECVTHIEGPLMILAGAGSGKTNTITRRIAYLIERGAPPTSILSLTFTNKAAREMKERALALLEGEYQKPVVSTFHSFGRWVLRRFANLVGLSEDFVIFDDSDQLTVVKRIVQELNLEEKEFPSRAFLSLISKVKISMLDPETAIKGVGRKWQTPLLYAYNQYHKILKENNAVDFDDLLVRVVGLLQTEPQVLGFLQERFLFVQVDEYQDTNLPQYLIVKMIAQEHRNLCVVGDDDQSIYSWRGANTENLRLFERDFPEAKVVKLEENYRSTQIILDAAWQVISKNKNRKEKRLWTRRNGGEPIVLFAADTAHAEADYVARKIEDLRLRLPEIAVLYRTNAQSRLIEEALMRRGIPYRVVGGLRFYDRKEIKDIIAYLRLLVNPEDKLAFSRIVNTPPRGIGAATIKKIMDLSEETGSLNEALRRIATGEADASPTVQKRVERFYRIMEHLRAKGEELPLEELFEEIYKSTGYLQALQDEKSIESESRIENLKELLNVASEFEEEDDPIKEFLDRATLTTSQDEGEDEGNNRVTLMTLHSAKGLEFQVVFMIGMEEGLLPHSKSLNDSAAMEEERRLCYVGMTRAKELLFLTRAWSRQQFGRETSYLPSSFLKDIPEELTVEEMPQRARTLRKTHKVTEPQRIPTQGLENKDNGDNWRKGDTVLHRVFGQGVIESVMGRGEKTTLVVSFETAGKRVLKASVAPLEKVG